MSVTQEELDTITATAQILFPRVKKPGQPMPLEDIGSLLNQIVWMHRSEDWKLLGKDIGSSVPMPNGRRISSDYIVHGPTKRGWDIFFNAGGDTMRVERATGEGEDLSNAIASGQRSLVDPVRPAEEFPTHDDIPHDDAPHPVGDNGGTPDIPDRASAEILDRLKLVEEQLHELLNMKGVIVTMVEIQGKILANQDAAYVGNGPWGVRVVLRPDRPKP